MKYKFKLFLCAGALFCLSASTLVHAERRDGCDIKYARLETELAHARAQGNVYRIRGLERALENVSRYCYRGGYINEQAEILPAGANNTGCDRKRANLERELQYARQYGNRHRIEGLERALSNVNTYCSDRDLIRDLQEDIDDKMEDIAELEEELAEAMLRGDPEKIARKEAKLAEALEELADLKLELESYSVN